jgi:hypothetical protein
MGGRGYTSPTMQLWKEMRSGFSGLCGWEFRESVDDFGNERAILNEGIVVERL